MLLRLRVGLADRPGSLGQVAQTLGIVGADIVHVSVLERVGGRAVDDFTVIWPASASMERVLAGIEAMPGVRVDGIWRASGMPEPGGREIALLGQLAANPTDGMAALVAGVPALFSADWAAVIAVDPKWADGGTNFRVVRSSPGTPRLSPLLSVAPVRPRAYTAPGGGHLAVAPFGRDGLVLLTSRGEAGQLELGAGPRRVAFNPPPFHRSEVERLAQLVSAASLILGPGVATALAA
jgi:hypothetical protein